jgi:hypothetical protein
MPLLNLRVADPHHFNADPDPDPAFLLDVDQEPTLYINVDPDTDPAPHQSDANLQPRADRLSRASF